MNPTTPLNQRPLSPTRSDDPSTTPLSNRRTALTKVEQAMLTQLIRRTRPTDVTTRQCEFDIVNGWDFNIFSVRKLLLSDSTPAILNPENSSNGKGYNNASPAYGMPDELHVDDIPGCGDKTNVTPECIQVSHEDYLKRQAHSSFFPMPPRPHGLTSRAKGTRLPWSIARYNLIDWRSWKQVSAETRSALAHVCIFWNAQTAPAFDLLALALVLPRH